MGFASIIAVGRSFDSGNVVCLAVVQDARPKKDARSVNLNSSAVR